MLAGLWSLTLAAAAAVACSQATLDPTCIGTGLCSNEFLRNSLTSQIKILTFVPQNLDPSITFLNLAGNNISSLNGSELIRYFYLQKM